MRGTNFHIKEEILIRISEGDEDAFRELFYCVLPWLTPFIRSMAKSAEGTQEIVQETFIRIWMSRDKLPGLLEPGAWMIRVATNECFTYFNKQAASRKMTNLQDDTIDAVANVGEDRLQVKETQLLIQQAVNKLSPQRKKIYQMSREQGLKTAEIAEQLHCSHSYVKNTLSAALGYIREYLIAAGKIIPLLFLLH